MIFKLPPIRRKISESLYASKRDLLDAKHQKEFWTCHVDLLEQRVARLEAELEQMPPEPDTWFKKIKP